MCRCKAFSGYVVTFSFLPFNRLWVNKVGNPHFLCVRSVLNIFIYNWQFFWELKDKRRHLKIHLSVYDVVPLYLQKRWRRCEKNWESASLNSPPSFKWRIYQVIMISNDVPENWKVFSGVCSGRGNEVGDPQILFHL